MLLGGMDHQDLLQSENSQVSCQSGRQVFGAWAERDTAGSSYLVGARLIFVDCARMEVPLLIEAEPPLSFARRPHSRSPEQETAGHIESGRRASRQRSSLPRIESHGDIRSCMVHWLEEARKLTSSREILLWMTPSEAPKALQASECSELLDPTRASCWIFAQR